MVKVIDGDLFDSKADIIAHSCNMQGKMGSGVAKQVREKYPEVFKSYSKYYKNFGLGEVQFTQAKDGKIIANMFGQYDYGYDGKQYTSYDALRKCFRRLYYEAKENNKTVAMPWRVGSCRGGADWNVVYKMIEEIFTDVDVELWRFDKD